MAQAAQILFHHPEVVEILGGPAVFERRPRSPAEWHRRILEGLPYAAVEAVMRSLGLTRSEVCETLDVSARTISRRKAQKRLQPAESDRLYRVARLAVRAAEVLGDADKAARWLHRPNRALGGETPLRLLRTDLGSRQVEQALGRLEHGVAG